MENLFDFEVKLNIFESKSKKLTYEDQKVDVRKVTNRFEYFLLIFTLRLGMTLKVVGIDVELNSLSNGDIFKGGHRAKKLGFYPKYTLFH